MKKYITSFLCIICIFSAIVPLGGCSSSPKITSVKGYALNTIIQIDAYSKTSPEVLNNAISMCNEYEKLFSRTLESSVLYKVNHQQTNTIPKELGELIQYGINMSVLTDGAFDITIGSVSQLWDFNADSPQPPTDEEIIDALSHVNYKNINLIANTGVDTWTINIPEGTVIDLGAIAKGYIADKIKEFLVDNGVTSAIINLGGNVLCVGKKASNADFSIGIKKPFTQKGENVAVLSLDNMSAVSSGVYERYFYYNDIFYHHLLNPKTGFPFDNTLLDVTIISDKSIDGDCLSTACFSLGLENGMKLIESMDNTEAVFVTEDNKLHYSSGAKKYID